ncbi:hypothetical protein PROFUN_01479 [Planoprotostelium fungivorum]|uniref:Uncharacterized protein n=1 Tax=Planoprotostelium fungivorum TaxID=1890364 RepID=A0A2P6NTB9_9EUKA|nr:hypothetical protein PROFUN_01479 [Planoprotostelium fungivorum]
MGVCLRFSEVKLLKLYRPNVHLIIITCLKGSNSSSENFFLESSASSSQILLSNTIRISPCGSTTSETHACACAGPSPWKNSLQSLGTAPEFRDFSFRLFCSLVVNPS